MNNLVDYSKLTGFAAVLEEVNRLKQITLESENRDEQRKVIAAGDEMLDWCREQGYISDLYYEELYRVLRRAIPATKNHYKGRVPMLLSDYSNAWLHKGASEYDSVLLYSSLDELLQAREICRSYINEFTDERLILTHIDASKRDFLDKKRIFVQDEGELSLEDWENNEGHQYAKDWVEYLERVGLVDVLTMRIIYFGVMKSLELPYNEAASEEALTNYVNAVVGHYFTILPEMGVEKAEDRIIYLIAMIERYEFCDEERMLDVLEEVMVRIANPEPEEIEESEEIELAGNLFEYVGGKIKDNGM